MSEDTEWMSDGRCRGYPADFFFPADGVGVEAARRVCAACTVRVECLDYAIAHHVDHGVWGGTSERGRRRLAQRQGLAVRSGQAVRPYRR